MRIDVLTTFPEMFDAQGPAALGVSIPARARAAGLIDWHAHDIRAHAGNKHDKTDDRPFGGGPGMVMSAQPVWDAVQHVEQLDPVPAHRVLMTPQGKPLTQADCERLAKLPRLLVIAGHYEGLDQRVVDALDPEEISLGDFVISGGELAAMVLIDALARLQPGALGDENSALQDSFSPAPTEDVSGSHIPKRVWRDLGIPPGQPLLDCPHYTKPRVWNGIEVPEVLLSGDHGRIAAWRLQQALERTKARRPDLLSPPEDA